MNHVDCVVIGAGVVGLSIARALAQAGRQVFILEASNAIGTGTSYYCYFDYLLFF